MRLEIQSVGKRYRVGAVRDAWLVTGAVRSAEGVQLRVIADARPDASARPVPPSLEDAYLGSLAGARADAAEEGR